MTTAKTPALVERERAQRKAVKDLLHDAAKIVASVDESDFSKKHTVSREFPEFQHTEILAGPILGEGGFGVVLEVEKIQLKGQEQQSAAPAAAAAAAPITTNQNGKNVKFEQQEFNKEEEERDRQLEKEHYDVHHARTLMATIQRRQGTDARYAIKRLHSDLSDLERARGMIDLAIETKVLSRLWHPNIIKMRGYSAGSRLDRHGFIILDRLYETLDQKIIMWSNDLKELHSLMKTSGALMSLFRGADNASSRKHREEAERDILLQRMLAIYDLASALSYMHKNRLVYRDIKQENIGFDVRGDVKIFDFGLAKGLSEKLRATSRVGRPVYGYNLTVRTGSIPYMAPEVALKSPYDTKCDVWSLSILVWEILMLKRAFKDYTRLEFLRRVVQHKERPKWTAPKKLPPLTKLMVEESWEHDPQKRPDMKRVAAMVRGDLNDLSSDASVQDRTSHMRDRSSHSQRLQRIELMRAQSLRRERPPSGRDVEFEG